MSVNGDLNQIQANMKKVTQRLKSQGAKALNKIARQAMKKATKTVADDVGVPVKTIRGRSRLIARANFAKPKAEIRVNRMNMPAIRLFENRSTKLWSGRGGIVIGKYAIKRGFIQTLKNGRKHVMQRQGKARYSIDVVKIPLATPLTNAFKHALVNYPQQLQQELKLAFNQI